MQVPSLSFVMKVVWPDIAHRLLHGERLGESRKELMSLEIDGSGDIEDDFTVSSNRENGLRQAIDNMEGRPQKTGESWIVIC
jgi:hypothetical protein